MPTRSSPLPPLAGVFLANTMLLLTDAGAQQFVPEAIPQGSGAFRVPVPIDLDADRDLDFVALVDGGQGLRQLRNLGHGRWAVVGTTPANGLTPLLDRHAAAGDLDGDGDADLLLSAGQGGDLVLLPNQQGLLQGPPVPLPATGTSTTSGARLLDVDRDGDLDVVVLGPSRLALLHNDGRGNFTVGPPTALPMTNGLVAAETTDLDRDGATDLVVVQNQQLGLWLARNGRLVAETDQRLPAQSPPVRALAVADLDGDGAPEIAATGALAPQTAVLFANDGTGHFTDASSALGTLAGTATAVVPIDVDGDGDLDLTLDAAVLRNDGAISFAPAGNLSIQPIAALDLDGDAWDDAMTTSGLARNDHGRGFTQPFRCSGTIPGDLDDDGDLDVIGRTNGAWTNEGSRRAMRLLSASPRQVATFADLDGDGDQDLAQRGSNAVQVYANDGAGNLTLALTFPALPAMDGPIVGFDLERDGDVDLAWTSGWLGTATPVVMRNDGNLTFTDIAAAALPTNSIPIPVLIGADIDGDGWQDLLAASQHETALLRNRGDGTFEDFSGHLPTGAFAGAIVAFQADRDPELELLVLGSAGTLLDRVGVDWTAVGQRLPMQMSGVTRAVATDYDTDGDQDLILGGTSGRLLRNDGNGQFTDDTAVLGPVTAAPIAAFDADGDGDPDLCDGSDLWINRQRQLEDTTPVAAGGALELAFVGPPAHQGADICIATLGLVRSRAGLPLLGGTLLPDPRASVPVGALVSIGGSVGTLRLPVPATPELRGLTLQMQGLVIDPTGQLALANHLVAAIE